MPGSFGLVRKTRHKTDVSDDVWFNEVTLQAASARKAVQRKIDGKFGVGMHAGQIGTEV